jgi:NADP-dependent 3-hydroxy acid dehydrogenase YdfG
MSVMVITGGTAGAGKATALRFARAGYHVALIARDETGLQETRQACERFGIKTLAISADVVDAGALQRAAAEVEPPSGNRRLDQQRHDHRAGALSSDERGGFRRVTEVTYLGT